MVAPGQGISELVRQDPFASAGRVSSAVSFHSRYLAAASTRTEPLRHNGAAPSHSIATRLRAQFGVIRGPKLPHESLLQLARLRRRPSDRALSSTSVIDVGTGGRGSTI